MLSAFVFSDRGAILVVLPFLVGTVGLAQTESQFEQLEYSSDVMYEAGLDLHAVKASVNGAVTSIGVIRDLAEETLGLVDPGDVEDIEDFIDYLDDLYDDGDAVLLLLAIYEADLEDAYSGYQDAIDLWFAHDFAGAETALLTVSEQFNGGGGNGIFESFIGFTSQVADDFVQEIEDLCEDLSSDPPTIVPAAMLTTMQGVGAMAAGDYSIAAAGYHTTHNSLKTQHQSLVAKRIEHKQLIRDCQAEGASEEDLESMRVNDSAFYREFNRLSRLWVRQHTRFLDLHAEAKARYASSPDHTVTISKIRLATNQVNAMDATLTKMHTEVDKSFNRYFQAVEDLNTLLSSLKAQNDPMNPPTPGDFSSDWERADDAINQLDAEITGEIATTVDT